MGRRSKYPGWMNLQDWLTSFEGSVPSKGEVIQFGWLVKKKMPSELRYSRIQKNGRVLYGPNLRYFLYGLWCEWKQKSSDLCSPPEQPSCLKRVGKKIKSLLRF